MALVGNLDEFSLTDLIQTYCSSRQTTRLRISWSDADAQVFIHGGELVDARFGDLVGEAAVLAALRRSGGRFQAELGVESAERTVTRPWHSIAMEAVRRPADPYAAPTTTQAAVRPRSIGDAPRFSATPPPRAEAEASGSGRALAVGGGLLLALLVGGGVYWYLNRASSAGPGATAGGGRTITLGMSAALTGPAKELGRQMKLGVETSLKLVNEAGGINGHRFELLALDDGYEPTRTRETMRELVEQRKVFAVVGNVGTPTAEVAVPYAIEKGVLFFGAFTGASLLRKSPPDRYVFNFRASYAEETADVVRYLIDARRIRPEQIAVFAQQDGFGDAGFAGVARALRRYGRGEDEILRVGFKRNTLDIDEAVKRIVAERQNLRAVVTVAPYRPAAKFIEEIRQAGLDLTVTNVSFVGSTALAEELRQLGPSYCNGIIVTQVVPQTDSASTAVIRYREALAKYFPGEKPDFVSLEGYLASQLLLEGFRRAGVDPTTDSVIGALEQIQNFEMGIGTTLSFGPSEHQASHKVWGTSLNEACVYQGLDLE